MNTLNVENITKQMKGTMILERVSMSAEGGKIIGCWEKVGELQNKQKMKLNMS